MLFLFKNHILNVKKHFLKARKQSLKISALIPAAFLLSALILSGCGSGSSGKSTGAAPAADSGSAAVTAESGAPSAGLAETSPSDPAQADPDQAASAAPAEAAPAKAAADDSSKEISKESSTRDSGQAASDVEEEKSETASSAAVADSGSATEKAGETGEGERRLLKYIDAWDEWHTMEVDPAVSPNIYDPEGFVYNEESGQMTYTVPADPDSSSESGVPEESYEILQGVDVSEHQGYIDWNAVAEAGYRFAFIRVGYRGYGEAGNVFEDATAVDNLQAAKAAGLRVGAYFFSQALSADEAREEAGVALGVIERSGVSLDLPLMYDPEIIKDDWGRANDITRDQVAVNTAAFRDAVESSSPWKVDIYSNLPWEHNYFDADTMNQFEIWYADYERTPQTPYHFVWWQYTNEGYVPGIQGRVDLNLWMKSATKNESEEPSL